MSKKQTELLGSRLKGWNLVYQHTEICSFCNSQNEFKEFFSQENDLVFCNDECSVIKGLGHQHDPTEWHLFIETSKVSSTAVLLHNGNEFPSAALAHAANMKESYENMKLLLEMIQYKKYTWNICGDLKVLLSCLATKHFVAFCVSGIVGREKKIIHLKIVSKTTVTYFRTEKCTKYFINQP